MPDEITGKHKADAGKRVGRRLRERYGYDNETEKM